jgi:hypothetical protein
MSPLPQRKKTAEEIAKLRESLGIPPAAPPPPTAAQSPATREVADSSEIPPPEEAPDLVVEELIETPPAHGEIPSLAERDRAPTSLPEPITEVETEDMARLPKPVRSLRKSERLTQPRASTARTISTTETKLPAARHSESELNELRRRQMTNATSPAAHLQALTARPLLVGIGYFLALAGGVGGLAVAAYLWRKKPRSAHHAGFIAAMAFFVMVFGALYIFPQLRNGT